MTWTYRVVAQDLELLQTYLKETLLWLLQERLQSVCGFKIKQPRYLFKEDKFIK